MALSGAALLAAMGCANQDDSIEARGDRATARQEPVVPEGFDKIETTCNFHFYGPPETRSIPAQGIDSCVVRLEVGDCQLAGGAGAFSDRLASAEDEPEFAREKVDIDGRSSTFARFRRTEEGGDKYVAALHVPISDKDGWYISIDLEASCATRESRDNMRRVLLTVDPGETW